MSSRTSDAIVHWSPILKLGMHSRMLSDGTLLQIVDRALADTARKSGAWLVCKPGCSQCCHGAFAINLLDVKRLRAGLEELGKTDPERARRVVERAAAYVDETREQFPGDPETGVLGSDEASQDGFEAFENERACPVLDPESQTCDLYTARPMTCRVFGPPVRNAEGFGVCELCYDGATSEEIANCELIPDPDRLEDKLLSALEAVADCNENMPASTIVAHAVAGRGRQPIGC